MTTLREVAQQALETLENDTMQRTYAGGVRITNAAIALRAALDQPMQCHWFQDGDEDSDTYMASCSRRYFVLDDGTPTDNRMTHCCYCGRPLVEVPIEPEDNHE